MYWKPTKPDINLQEKKTKTGSKKVTRSKKSKKTKRRSSTTVTTTTISNSKPVTPDKDKDSKDQRKQRTKRKDPFEKEWFGKECDDVTRCKVPIQEFKIAEGKNIEGLQTWPRDRKTAIADDGWKIGRESVYCLRSTHDTYEPAYLSTFLNACAYLSDDSDKNVSA